MPDQSVRACNLPMNDPLRPPLTPAASPTALAPAQARDAWAEAARVALPTGDLPAAGMTSAWREVNPRGGLHAQRHCPLCHHPVQLSHRPDSRCPTCQSPLAALPGPGAAASELLGRRGAVRRDQGHVALMHLGWPSNPVPVRWRDLSLTGLSLYTPQPVPVGQRLRLIDSAIEVVAEVVDSRPQGRVHAVHARLVTALLLQSTGVFVSTKA